MLGKDAAKPRFLRVFPEAVREETRQDSDIFRGDHGNGGFFGWLGWRRDRRKLSK